MLKQALSTVVVALAVTACTGDAGQDSASPSPTESPTPTATPIAIPAEFASQMQAADGLKAELSGSIEVAGIAGELSGTLEAVGTDSHQVVSVAFAALPAQETEVIVVGSTTYKLEDGIWIRSTTGSSDEAGGIDAIIDAALEDPDGLVLAGTELVDGDRLHRLEISPGPTISPVMLGLRDPTIADFEAELRFLAEDDGTPAGMGVEATWVQGEEPVPASIEMLFRFDWGADDLEITAPEDAWEMHRSDPLLYRMAYPVGWRATHERATGELLARDIYFGPANDEVQVYRYTDLTLTYDDGEVVSAPSAEEWFDASANVLLRDFGVEPDVANMMFLSDGIEVRVLTLHFAEGDEETFFQEAVIFSGTAAWDVDMYSSAGNEVEDGVTLLNMIMSFEPEG